MKTPTHLILIALAALALASSAAAQTITIEYEGNDEDFNICASESTINLSSNIDGANGCTYTYTWSTPDGNGSFNGTETSQNATYTQNDNGQTVTIELTATYDSGGNNCDDPLEDEIEVTFDPEPTANAGSDQTVCANNADVTLNGSVTNATGGTWTGGAGTYTPDANTLSAIYAPTAAEISNGSVSLTLTSTDNGDCVAESDVMNITITPAPTANAGSDETVCANNAIVVLAGSVNVATGGTWTGGLGSFSPNANNLSASYTPTENEIANGGVTLTLTTTGNGDCVAVTDEVDITITPAPTANAGSDQTVCANNAIVVLAGSVNVATGGTWTGGLGSFSPNANNLSASYTPTENEIANGEVTLTLTTTGNGNCVSVNDEVDITITLQPTIETFEYDSFYCSDETVVQLPTFQGTAGGTYDCNGCGLNINDGSFVPDDLGAGSYNVDYEIPAAGGCPSASVSASFTINEAPVADAGNYVYNTLCNELDIELAGSSSFANGITWSSSISGGNFDNQNALNTNYTPPAGLDNVIQFTLTSTGLPGCANASDDVSFTLIPPPNAQLSSLPAHFCEGNVNVLSADQSPNNNAYSFSWNTTGIIGSSTQSSVQFDPGPASDNSSVSVTLTEFINDNTCQATNVFFIDLLYTPVICDYFELAGNILGVNVCEADDSEYFYQWGCGTTDFEGENENFLLYADYEDNCNGDYYVSVSLYEDGSCTVYGGADPTVSISEEDLTQYLQLYPNPTSDILQLSWELDSSEPLVLLIYDINGRLVYQSTLRPGERFRNISVGHLNAGNYRLALQSTERLVQQSFVITN